MEHDMNQRSKSFKGATKGNWKGRTDYDDGRPTKNTERVPELGDRGIPPSIDGDGAARQRGPVVDVAGGGDKGIPPMNSNPHETNAPKVKGGGSRD